MLLGPALLMTRSAASILTPPAPSSISTPVARPPSTTMRRTGVLSRISPPHSRITPASARLTASKPSATMPKLSTRASVAACEKCANQCLAGYSKSLTAETAEVIAWNSDSSSALSVCRDSHSRKLGPPAPSSVTGPGSLNAEPIFAIAICRPTCAIAPALSPPFTRANISNIFLMPPRAGSCVNSSLPRTQNQVSLIGRTSNFAPTSSQSRGSTPVSWNDTAPRGSL